MLQKKSVPIEIVCVWHVSTLRTSRNPSFQHLRIKQHVALADRKIVRTRRKTAQHNPPFSQKSGQSIIFHQPRFLWNKGISLTKPQFGVRSREVAIIWPEKFTKCCACHEKWHLNFTPCCTCHETWHLNFTKCCGRRKVSLEPHQVLHLPRKVTIEPYELLHLRRKVTLEFHHVLHLPRKVTLQLHQVLHLPRIVTLQPHQVLHLPQKLRFELHHVLHLPRQKTRTLNPRHI